MRAVEKTGQDRTGQDRTGQDRTGQDRQDRESVCDKGKEREVKEGLSSPLLSSLSLSLSLYLSDPPNKQ